MSFAAGTSATRVPKKIIPAMMDAVPRSAPSLSAPAGIRGINRFSPIEKISDGRKTGKANSLRTLLLVLATCQLSVT
jgi:hypothetical protein